jgi:hypothetical protein
MHHCDRRIPEGRGDAASIEYASGGWRPCLAALKVRLTGTAETGGNAA